MLDQLSILLARPIYPVNIGSVARLCVNFGVNNLIVVDPKCKLDVSDARKFATIRGQEILFNAKIESSVAESIGNAQVVVGFTTRVGEGRVPTMGIGQIGKALLAGANTVLMFGSEDNGLDANELSHCTHVCQIPTRTMSNSINLSHAVAIALARIFEDVSHKAPEKRYISELASQGELQKFNEKVQNIICADTRFAGRIERLIKKSNMTSSEVRLIYFLLKNASNGRFDGLEKVNNQENLYSEI